MTGERWAVKTREDGPEVYYGLYESLEEAMDAFRSYRRSDARHTYIVTRDRRAPLLSYLEQSDSPS